MPPEIFSNSEYDSKLFDIYSCGIILFHLLTGVVPFPDADVTKENCFYSKVMENYTFKNQFKKKYKNENCISNSALRLFFALVVQEPELRPSIQDILDDGWLEDDYGDEIAT